MIILTSGNYNAFKNEFNADTAGAYAISGLIPSHKFKLPIYIGGTENIKHRVLTEHLSELDRNVHNNPLLQNYYNKYGKENIVTFCLEESSPDDCFNTEQKYLDLYRPFADEFGGFNICHEAKPGMGGREHSKETKRKIGLKSKGRIHTNQSRKKISQSLMGHKTSIDTRNKIAQGRSREFTVLSPDGEIITGKNLAEFCRQNRLEQNNLRNVIKGKVRSHKGWMSATHNWDEEKMIKAKIKQEQKAKEKSGRPKKPRKPRTEEHKRNLSIARRKRVFSEETKRKMSESHKGKIKTQEHCDNISKGKGQLFKIKSPDGEIIEGCNLLKFSRNNQLSQPSLSAVINGKRQHHKGWTQVKQSKIK